MGYCPRDHKRVRMTKRTFPKGGSGDIRDGGEGYKLSGIR